MFQINIIDPNWRETDQLAIYKHDRGVELGSTEKQLQLSGQSGTWTHRRGPQSSVLYGFCLGTRDRRGFEILTLFRKKKL